MHGLVQQPQRHPWEMVRDLMLESVERRFGAVDSPHPIQWPSHNGSAYRAYETIDFAIQLGLAPPSLPCAIHTNGMSGVREEPQARFAAEVTS